MNQNLHIAETEKQNSGYNQRLLKPFEKKVWLSSPTMHGEELQYMTEAYRSNWMSTIGENINEIEKSFSEYIGCENAFLHQHNGY